MKLPAPHNRPESIDSILAKNLLIARLTLGFTQSELATRSLISRATIAQIEAGYSDPRASTVIDLARGLNLPPMLLLLGRRDIQAIINVSMTKHAEPRLVTDVQVAHMNALLATGLVKDMLRAARIGGLAAQTAGATPAATVAASIFSTVHPGAGTAAGRAFVDTLADPS